MKTRRLSAVVVMALSYLVGSIPFSGLVARLLRGVDLRDYGTGTVSGTGLYRVAGFGPLVVGGVLDVAKGSVGPA
ncbi:MAG: glycerol-3-phosphate acyltransferase, partial [Acidimicrobiia bacterium]